METSLRNGNFPLPKSRLTPEEEFMARLHEMLHRKAFNSGYSVPRLCRDIGMSSSQLHRKLTGLTGRPVITLIISMRLERAKALLVADRQYPIKQVAFDCGFNDPDYFSRRFSKRFGVSPTKFREGYSLF